MARTPSMTSWYRSDSLLRTAAVGMALAAGGAAAAMARVPAGAVDARVEWKGEREGEISVAWRRMERGAAVIGAASSCHCVKVGEPRAQGGGLFKVGFRIVEASREGVEPEVTLSLRDGGGRAFALRVPIGAFARPPRAGRP